MILRPGVPVQVVSTKYDGSHHYRYTLMVESVEPDRLRAFAPAGNPLDSYRGRFGSGTHMLWIHVAGQDWNLSVNWFPDWAPRSHYVNVALPSTWDDGTLRFVDLDLDVIWRADGTVLLDDEQEFADHRERFGYPPDLVARAWRAVDEVRGLIDRRQDPFDGSLYEWRP